MRKPKKLLITVLCITTALTGCSKESEGKPEAAKNEKMANAFKETFLEKKELEFYPPGMTDSGEKIWGNGKGEGDDIFSVLERKIWGDD